VKLVIGIDVSGHPEGVNVNVGAGGLIPTTTEALKVQGDALLVLFEGIEIVT
jgi:hypothetical protein